MDLILVAIVNGIVGIVIAIISLRANHNAKVARKHAASSDYQTANDHDTNLRVELDERFTLLFDWMKRMDRSIGGVRDDHRELTKLTNAIIINQVSKDK